MGRLFFANSLTSLIPENTTVDIGVSSISHGSADRTTHPTHMLAGTLKKITYPTKGYTEYALEANEYEDFQINGSAINAINIQSCVPYQGADTYCCDNTGTNSNGGVADMVITQEIINTGIVSVLVTAPHPTQCAPSNPYASNAKFGYMKIIDVTNGNNNLVYSAHYDIPLFGNTASGKVYLDEINLAPGNTYRFTIDSEKAVAALNLNYDPNVPVNRYAGGLRVKQIKTHDGISSANDIIRTFSYKKSDNSPASSGVIINRPVFGYRYGGGAIFSSHSVLALSSIEGNHITYSRVKESLNSNGHVEYLLNIEKEYADGKARYPIRPNQFVARNGTLKEKKIFKG